MNKVHWEEQWNTGRVKGICGSAIIDAIAEMFRVGILTKNGRFRPGVVSPRIREGESGPEYIIARAQETSIGRDIPISQRDVRQIQLAKAALYVAARTLLHEMGLDRPDKIILAGAFGSYIDEAKAMLLGMIPDCPLEDVYAVGNAAGDGARIALLNVEKRTEAARVACGIQRFELPTDAQFQERFMQALDLPHARDPFPHVAHLVNPKSQPPRLKPAQ